MLLVVLSHLFRVTFVEESLAPALWETRGASQPMGAIQLLHNEQHPQQTASQEALPALPPPPPAHVKAGKNWGQREHFSTWTPCLLFRYLLLCESRQRRSKECFLPLGAPCSAAAEWEMLEAGEGVHSAPPPPALVQAGQQKNRQHAPHLIPTMAATGGRRVGCVPRFCPGHGCCPLSATGL